MYYDLDTNFEGANATDVEMLPEGQGKPPTMAFAADPRGGPEAMWFRFRIRTLGPGHGGQPLRLLLKHYDNLLGAARPCTLQPVVRYGSGPWQRMGKAEMINLPDGRAHVAWTIDAPEEAAEVALCYPYDPPDVETLVEETGGVYRLDTIGLSQGGRPLWRLSNGPGQPADEQDAEPARPGIYLIARQHSGETPGSWVLDGLLRAMAELQQGGAATPLVWCVPLSNTDGVIRGDYGKDNYPYDLNRAWGRPPMRHETLVIQRDVGRWLKRCRPVLFADFHAPGMCETGGIYTFTRESDRERADYAEIQAWLEAFAEAIGPELVREPFHRHVDYPSRWETPNARAFGMELPGTVGMTLEIPYTCAHETLLTRQRYQDIGRRIAEAILGRLA